MELGEAALIGRTTVFVDGIASYMIRAIMSESVIKITLAGMIGARCWAAPGNYLLLQSGLAGMKKVASFSRSAIAKLPTSSTCERVMPPLKADASFILY